MLTKRSDLTTLDVMMYFLTCSIVLLHSLISNCRQKLCFMSVAKDSKSPEMEFLPEVGRLLVRMALEIDTCLRLSNAQNPSRRLPGLTLYTLLRENRENST